MEEIVNEIHEVRASARDLFKKAAIYMQENELLARDEDNLDFLIYHLEDIIDMLDVSLERIGRTS